MNLNKEQIEKVIDWMNTWEQLKGTAIPLRFKEEFMEKLSPPYANQQQEQLSCNTCKFYPVDYDSYCATCYNFEKHEKVT